MATNHGSSTRITQGPEPIIAKAQFMDFAPAPCSLYGCCISEHQQVRMYAHVKETNMEMNFPEAPYGCCTCDEQCVNDGIVKMYYDRPVHRSGLCPYPYCCIPFTCCGPPVIFTKEPTCCFGFISLASCFGIPLMSAKSNFFGCKTMICCGDPCYTSTAMLLMPGIKEPGAFLAAYKGAYDAYIEKHKATIPEEQRVIFELVKDGDIGGGAAAVHSAPAPGSQA